MAIRHEHRSGVTAGFGQDGPFPQAVIRVEAHEALRAALPTRPEAVVLAGVDRPAAIAWGWEMGITLFQGRLIESRRRGA